MKIKKMYQGSIPENKIVSTYSNSQTDVYSCEYVNNIGGSGGEVDLSNYYNKTETEVLVDNKIAAIPEVDLTDYYTKEQSETMVDEKIEAIPTNDLLHYKGQVASVDDLPSGGQPNAPEVAPVLSVGELRSTQTVNSSCVSKFNELKGSYKYLIATGRNGSTSNALKRARIWFNSSSVLDGCCPLSSTSLALHFNASTSMPVYVYGTDDIDTIYYDDGTTVATTTSTTTITKPFWVKLTLNNWENGSYVVVTTTNIDFDLKLKFPPTRLGFLSQEYVTFHSTTLNTNYIEGYYVLSPIGLTVDTTGWFKYYEPTGTGEANENDCYTVGSKKDIYRYDSTSGWQLWSESEKVDLSSYYTKEETDTAIDNKIAAIPETDLSNYYNKQEAETMVDNKIDAIPDVDLSDYYTKTQTDTAIDNKIDAIPETDLSNYYNKGEVDDLIENIPSSESVAVNNDYNTSTTETYSCSYINNLSAGEGVDLSNYYTKTETDTAIDNKISAIPKTDLSNYYNKSETEDLVDNKISAIPETDLTNYYNKTETENLVNSSIEAIPETDLSSYYTKTETDTAIDNKIEAIPKTTDIVDSGSNANGNWIKYSDGTMICCGEKNLGDVACTSSWGYAYESPVIDFGSYPQTFVEKPSLTLQQSYGGTCYPETLSNSTNEKLGTTWMWRPKSDTCREVIYSFIAIGKWK